MNHSKQEACSNDLRSATPLTNDLRPAELRPGDLRSDGARPREPWPDGARPHEARQNPNKSRFNEFQQTLIAQTEYYERLLADFEKEYLLLPSGDLQREKHKNHYHYFLRGEDKKRQYLRKTEKALIGQMLRKRFLKKALPQLRRNLRELQRAMGACGKIAEPVFETYDESEKIFEGAKGENAGSSKLSKEEKNWLALPSKKNDYHQENLVHLTANGEKVRSKSEALIAGLLYSYHIPYKYEEELLLEEIVYYPDFTIRRPKDGKIFYWEHFGMVEDPEYARRMDRKVLEYRQKGIAPWDNLITSYDKEGAIDMSLIQNMIKAFLL